MTAKSEPHRQRCDMWAIMNPDGTIMDSTVMKTQKDAVYNGFVWGRCGDDRTRKDFEKEGYRVIRVHVIPFTSAPAAQERIDAEIRELEERRNKMFESGIPCMMPIDEAIALLQAGRK